MNAFIKIDAAINQDDLDPISMMETTDNDGNGHKVYIALLLSDDSRYYPDDLAVFSTLNKAEEYILEKEDGAIYEILERTVF